jgi:Flp pilus assembly protein TadG
VKRFFHIRTEKGQSLTELALTATFLLILVAGVVDVGHAIFVYITLRDAAQEGAGFGAYAFQDTVKPTSPLTVSQVCTNITQRVRTHATQPVDLTDTTHVIVNITVNGTSCASIAKACAGQTINIVVMYDDLEITMPFIGTVIGTQTLDITADVNDRIITPICASP